jgi:UDP-N-acetylbacillosamine N-acetyltransferase
MNDIRGLLIFGFGGHARSVADIALACGIKNMCFIDANANDGECFLDFPVVKQWTKDLPLGWQVFSASGDNIGRRQHFEYFNSMNWPLATLIAPSAIIGIGSEIEGGCLIAHQAHVGPMATISIGCIINTCAVIEHECRIGEFTHVSVNATVAGRSKIGRFSMIGAGATVIDAIEIADNVVIGAGAVVPNSIFEPGVFVGVPVRRVTP